MSDDFDWKDAAEKGSRIVTEARETAAYLNSSNDVVIRQRADWPHEEEDPYVVIPLYRVRALIDRLDALLLEGYEHEKQTPI